MGLFDDVKCEAGLPADPPPPKGRWFQTKDTECPYLEKYTITKEGRLIHHVVRYDIDPPDKAVGPKDTNWNGDFSFGHYDTETREHWEYVAHFVDGQLLRIWLASHTPAEVAEQMIDLPSAISVLAFVGLMALCFILALMPWVGTK